MARKVKVKVRLDLDRDVKGSKKGFCKHIDDKMKIWENVGTVLNGPDVLTTQVYSMRSSSLSLLGRLTFRDTRPQRTKKTGARIMCFWRKSITSENKT